NATSLFPLSDDDRGARVVELAGGVVPLLAVGAAALGREDYKWAAEVADYVLAVDEENREARLLKAEALEALGEVQISANARNWYLTSAQWLREQAGPR
ncbi:MAG: alkyl/aryl-sulfatase, partial [Gemmatimonadota bacterium]|nr:alkyl/aryl-sulfatase [Gemmatimonadota bacterium]